uniref:Metallo-beta-lactamase domain-containing protein n=1 Tax=Globisporangium ultimum (strain ATCC 200006 / CBS 805.95 / DAOM BR144) TaxID=431595 RepID=K3WA17_GLOUD
MVSTAALVAGVLGGACALATAAYVAPSVQRHRSHRGVSSIPLSEYLSFEARVRWQSLLLWLSGVSKELEVLPDADTLTPNVIRILGQNPSRMTLRGTNTYLVGGGAKRILIDASDGNAAYMKHLMQVCELARVQEITDVLLTHGHYDHMGGILRVKEKFPNVRVWKYLPPNGGDRTLRVSNAECELLGIKHLEDGTEFPVSTGANGSDTPTMSTAPFVLRAVYTPGHYNDHMCFFLDDTATKSERALFSGDCILGAGSCVFDSLKELMTSLKLLQKHAPRVIYPGHGPVVTDAQAKIHEYISHREQRENQVLEVLRKASDALSTVEIVNCIYKKLPFALQLAARKAVDKHLLKLRLENRVVVQTHATWFQAPTYRIAA